MRTLLFILFCLIGFNVIAQESDSIAYSVDLDDFVVTAQYKPTHYKNALYKTSIIKEAAFEKRGVNQLDQALTISPKIRISYDPRLGTQLRLRGMPATNVAILIDGIPVIGRSDGGLDLSQIALNTIERIELIEGPVSAIYGNNAAGGVINLITKKSQVKPFTAQLSAQAESIGKRNANFNLGYQVGSLLLQGRAQYFKYDQFPEDSLRLRETVTPEDGGTYTRSVYPWNPKELYGGGATAKYYFNEDNTLIAKYDRMQEKVIEHGPVKRKLFNPYSQDMFFTAEREDAAVIFNSKIGNGLYIESISALNKYSRQIDEERYYFDTDSFDPDLSISDKTTVQTWFNRINLGKAITDKIELAGGLNYTSEMTTGGKLNNTEAEEPNQPEFDEWAIYSELKFAPINSLKLAASGRWNRHSVYDNRFTPAIQLQWQLNEKMSLRSSFAQGYRSPTLKELYLDFVDINHNVLGNAGLVPEISTDIQAVLSYQYNENLSLDLNAYSTMLENKIDLVQYEPARYRYDNIDSYDVRGFALDGTYTSDLFTFSSSYSLGFWSVGIEEESAPDYSRVFDMNHNLEINLPLGLTGNVNFRHQGSQPIYRLIDDEIIINDIGGSNFVDFSVNKSFLKDKLSLTIGSRNILNQTPSDVFVSNNDGNHTTTESRLLDQGRSFFTTLSYRL